MMSSLPRVRFRPALVAFVGAAALLLAACSSSGSNPDSNPDSNSVDDASVVVAVQSFATENPLPWFQTNADKALWSSMNEPLIRTNAETGAYEPGIALSWTPSKDYTQWTFELREDVKFHDGTELRAADVAFTLEQYMREDAASNLAVIFRESLDRIETPSDHTVVVTFSKPAWEVLDHFTDQQPFTVASKAYIERVGEEEARAHPITAGRYKFESASPDAYTFTRFDDYWDTENAAGFEEMEIRLVADPAAGVPGLRSGSLDAANVFGDALGQAQDAGLNIALRDGFVQYWIALPGLVGPQWPDYCPECPWVGDSENALKVREAMNLAVDKQAIVDGLWAGAGSLDPYSYWVFPTQKAWSPSFEVPGYDPDRAKQLLAEAGYPDGFDIKITSFRAAAGPDGPEVIQAVSNDWARVGIRANVTDGDQTTFIPQVNARDTGKSGQLYAAQNWASEPAALWNVTIKSTGPRILLAEAPDIDADLADILADLDPETRATKSEALATKLWERKYGVMLGNRAITWAISDNIDSSWDPGNNALNPRFYEMKPAG